MRQIHYSRCVVWRYKFKQRLYTEFLQTQACLQLPSDTQYEYVSNYDLPVDLPEQMDNSGYEVPYTSGYLEPLRRNNDDLPGYIEPNSYNNRSMFWQKVLANAKQSGVQKLLKNKSMHTSKNNKKPNAASEGNINLYRSSLNTCSNVEMKEKPTTNTCEDTNDACEIEENEIQICGRSTNTTC